MKENVSGCFFSEHSVVPHNSCYVPLDTLYVIPNTIFVANLLTGTKHPAFSTNHLAHTFLTKTNNNIKNLNKNY